MRNTRCEQVLALTGLLVLGPAARTAGGATIFVTSLDQKISSTGGCSLQEAIYSSNLQTNQAIADVSPDGTPQFIETQCVPGTGNDTIVLPTSATLTMSHAVPDVYNYLGKTATPLIISTITIEANGALLVRTGLGPARLFAVGDQTIAAPGGGTIAGTGALTIRNAFIEGFSAQGGDGGKCGGGGGMGAGGAIYVTAGQLTIENSTFEANTAMGGNSGGTCSLGDSRVGGGGGFSGGGGSFGGGGSSGDW